jgi:hypothetical protein
MVRATAAATAIQKLKGVIVRVCEGGVWRRWEDGSGVEDSGLMDEDGHQIRCSHTI